MTAPRVGSWAWADALEAAELQARIDHENGVCHLSEWSCSLCELESSPRPGPSAPLGGAE